MSLEWERPSLVRRVTGPKGQLVQLLDQLTLRQNIITTNSYY